MRFARYRLALRQVNGLLDAPFSNAKVAPRWWRWLAVLGLSSSMVVACGSGSDRPNDAQAGPSLSLELRTAVDGSAVDFGRIGGIVAAGDGTIYVADVQAQEIVSINADGTRRSVIGRIGAGPGEFRGLRGTLAWIDGRLHTFDWRNQQITLFDASGAVVGTISWPNGRFSGSALLTGGNQLFAREVIFPPIGAAGVPRPAPALQFAAFEGAGAPTPLPMPRDSVIWPQSMDCEAPSGAIHILGIPLRSWFPREAFLSNGSLAVAHRDSFVIEILDPSTGESVRQLTRNMPPIALTDERWESLPEVVEFRAIQQEANGDLWLPRDRSEACELPHPEHLPAVRAMASDEAGRLWIEIASPSGFRLNVFQDDGSFLGEADMPPRDASVPFYVRDNTLYLVTTDELDVQSIEVYEVRDVS